MTRKANTSGGAAAGGGFDFHARLGAIAAIHTLRGTPVQWTEGLTRAAPCAVSFETSGPGDDLALELADRSIIEIQARKALRADRRFWSAIDALCEGVHADRCKYGILIVCPNSSIPVRKGHALALRRIGERRNDSPSPEQATLMRRLAERGYDAEAVCKRIRIQTVAALDDARDAIAAAFAELRHICADDSQVPAAWKALCHDALSAIGSKGRRTVRNLSSCLDGSHIALAASLKNSPMAISSRLLRWTMLCTEHFEVPGMSQRLPTDGAWLPLTALVQEAPVEPASSVEEALADYRSLGQSSRTGGDKIDSSTIGTFRKRCVVVGGPGSGKSLLLRVLAREFAKDAFVCIRVRLRDLATKMEATGCSVEDGLLQLGLSGAGVSREELRAASLPDLVFLCDGLDECGDRQHDVVSGLRGIAAAHPSYRFVVTTRPIGYSPSGLGDWRHYDLLPLDEEDTAEHLETLCRCALKGDTKSTEDLVPGIRAYVEEGSPSGLLARSPLLLAFGAAVILKQKAPTKSKLELYERIFDLIDPSANRHRTDDPSKATRNDVLNHLGWLTTASPLLAADELERQCAHALARALGTTYLQARTQVEACLRYWEEKGVIERLRYPGTELIAFIHKTFGEYAAARHLSEMGSDEARQSIRDVLLNVDWEEVLDFSEGTSLATTLAELLVAEIEISEPDESDLNRVVGILVRDGVSLSPEQRKSFVDRMSLVARSEDRRKAYRAGFPLTEHDLSRMPEVEEMALSLVSASKEWSRLVGWAILTCHFPSSVARGELEEALRHFMERSGVEEFFVSRPLSSRIKVLIPDRRVFENFLYGALKSLLAEADTGYQDALIAEVCTAQKARVAMDPRFATVLGEVGREDALAPLYESTGLLDAFDRLSFDEFNAAEAQLLTEVVPSAFVGGQAGPQSRTGLKYVAALVTAAGVMRVPVRDVHVWRSDDAQLDAVHILLCAAARVFELPAERLAAEARRLIADVESLRREGKAGSLLRVLPAVDAREVEWVRAREVDIDSSLLEGLVLHPSQWVQHLASRFLDARFEGVERRDVCERLLERGSGDALFWAAALSAEVPASNEMLIQRLEGCAVEGLHHLFDRLNEQGCAITASHSAALENGLLYCGARTAASAAGWCEGMASSTDTWLVDLLESASRYWVEHEAPYPKSGGVVPDSPREALLRTRLRIAAPPFAELARLAGDSRRDVADAAIDGLVELATGSAHDRSKLVESILGKRFPVQQCRKLLGSNVPYGAEELVVLSGLCGDPDPAYRSVAVRGVLGHPEIDHEKAFAVADSMRSDTDGNVRDTVHRFLERGAKEGL